MIWSRTFLVLLLLWGTPSAHGFAPFVVGRTSTELHAVSVPLLDTYAGGGGWKTRQSRIDRVLEHARNHQRKREQGNRASSNASTRSAIESATLPFTLPTLTSQQTVALEQGQIVMEQSEMGRQGSGFVVQDIEGADEAAVWNALLDFAGYQENIHTVRSASVRVTLLADGTVTKGAAYGVPSTTRATFDVSKFRLSISCIFRYMPNQNYMELSLDNALQNSALQEAKGFWHTESISTKSGRPATRVWLLCDCTLSPWLPKFIMDLAAASAMPRASTWLRPAVQQMAVRA